ncbi:MAG: GNAT family N-acetyltransferase [Candidatus Thorarchaeota archaeon]|jgi:ribosomal protein S18 acetylase RimI-like enzyme
MDIEKRPFRYETDLDRVRAFLLDIYNLTNSLHYLIPIKIENHKYGPCGSKYTKKDDDDITIWELANKVDNSTRSKIIAVSHRGSAVNYHIEIHPDYKHLERELFLRIEALEKERKIVPNHPSRILMYTVEPDTRRIATLSDLGYHNHGLHEYNRVFPTDALVPDSKLPEGYTIRNIRGEQDYPEYIEVVGLVESHCGENMSNGKLEFLSEAEFYHQDLELITIAPDGKFAGFCSFRLDPFTKISEIELIGTHPNHKNLGLEKALVCEGLSRLKKYKPILICSVELDVSDEMNDIFESVGFAQRVEMNMWEKSI